ncbi:MULTISPECIES: hypothetical protein [unclassified Halomonas]|uniref:hypothetical protein n=1 Tax=unclassified Halomonas TaxID=2609666 RepID=UPI001CF135ED|nr:MULTISPECIES: hypothetical protein [unclassified Halomonas]MCA8866823.1 hypothetical protein [Halomonas sp. SBBP1]UZH10972.1 hypothetical protein OM794_04240 [Halomonas sp. BDJS001]
MDVTDSVQSALAGLQAGELMSSTLLSLLVIPVIYSGIDDFLNWPRRLTTNRGVIAVAGIN